MAYLADGGTGHDHLAMTVDVPQGNTSPLDVRLLGFTGHDFSLCVIGDLSGIAKVFLLLDGDKGKNKLASSSNVTVVKNHACGLPQFRHSRRIYRPLFGPFCNGH